MRFDSTGIILYVIHYQKCVTFYKDVIGLPVIFTTEASTCSAFGDAYLMVEQEEPTVVEVDRKYYELGFTLPGQRIGSSAWFNKLKGYLEEFGLISDDGLPALFYKRPEDGQKGLSYCHMLMTWSYTLQGKTSTS